jgi:lipase chaperone LimK
VAAPRPPQPPKRRRGWLRPAIALLVALAIANLWLLNRSDENSPTNIAKLFHGNAAPAGGKIAASNRGTGAVTNDTTDPTSSTHIEIESMITDVLGENSLDDNPAVFKQKLLGLLRAKYPPAYVARMEGLVGRYADYRVALGELKPAGDTTDPDALKATFEARRQLRMSFFDSAEYLTLFASEDRLDRYTVERLTILRDRNLSDSDRAARLAVAETHLSTDERAARAEVIQGQTAVEQTAAYDAQGTDTGRRFAERKAQWGTAAAERLAQLDDEKTAWNGRLDRYAEAERRQQAGQLSASELTALRSQLFTPQEQLRLSGALALRPDTSVQ